MGRPKGSKNKNTVTVDEKRHKLTNPPKLFQIGTTDTALEKLKGIASGDEELPLVIGTEGKLLPFTYSHVLQYIGFTREMVYNLRVTQIDEKNYEKVNELLDWLTIAEEYTQLKVIEYGFEKDPSFSKWYMERYGQNEDITVQPSTKIEIVLDSGPQEYIEGTICN